MTRAAGLRSTYVATATVVAICVVGLIASNGYVRTQDGDTQKDLRTVLQAAQTVRAQKGTYQAMRVGDLIALTPGLSYTPGSSTGPQQISVAVSGERIVLMARSDSGACFWVVDTPYGNGLGKSYPPTPCGATQILS